MIASLTRSIILLQLLTLTGLAALAVHLRWLAWPAALLAAAALMTLTRAAVIFNNYLLSGALRQPLHDGRPAPTLPLLARIMQEFWCSMQCWFRLFPLARPFRTVYGRDALPPVLMLHGYGANSGFWKPFAAALGEEGISHAAIDLEPVLAGIDDYAYGIDAEVDALLQASGASQVILLCHSMGGLAARGWMRSCGHERVARVITLGTPHFGSTLASYGPGLNARQMSAVGGQPSAWLQQLASSENEALRSLFVAVCPCHDNIVAPQASTRLPGATNIMVDLVGHVALGFDRAIRQLTLGHIRAARGAGQACRGEIEL